MKTKQHFKYQNDFELIKTFLQADGVSGFEFNVASTYANFAKQQGAMVTRDGLGSVIATVGKRGPSVLFAAHMDEVGFVVEQVKPEGTIKLSQLGRQWNHALLAKRLKVVTASGQTYCGTFGAPPVHVLPPAAAKQVILPKDMYLDCGFGSAADVKKAGISVGDPVVRVSEPCVVGNGDKFMGKAVDNRYGVAVMAKVLKRLKEENTPHQNVVHLVATSQEEVGSRGAKSAVQKLEPDVAVCLDTTVCHDTPNIVPGTTKLGYGVAVTIKDAFAISNPAFVKHIMEWCKKAGVLAYKFVALGGGNDADTLQFGGHGTPTVQIGLPTRYLHTYNEMASFVDFNAAVDLLLCIIRNFNSNALTKIKY